MGFWYCAGYLAVLGVLSHFVGEALPRRWFSPEDWLFRCRGWEQGGRIYKRLGIAHWKDHVPDMSRLMRDMRPKRLQKTPRDEGIAALLQETCVAELVHWVLILLAPVLCVLWPGVGSAVFCALDILLLNLPFILIQRYNRPKLLALQARRKKRAAKETPA